MKNWKSLLLLGLVFAAGVAVGVVGTRIAVRHLVQRAINHPEQAHNLVERELAWKLHLDKTQRTQVHAILGDMRNQLKEIRQQVQPQSLVVMSNANARITALLNPDQQARFSNFKQTTPLFTHPTHSSATNGPAATPPP